MKLIAIFLCVAAVRAAEPPRKPLGLPHPVQDKNLYLLSALEDSAASSDALRHNDALAALSSQKQKALANAAAACKLDPECYALAFRWSAAEIAAAGQAFRSLYRDSAPVRELADGPLRASGMYIRSNQLSGPDFLAQAWSECASGMNHMIDVYALGKPPRYAEIDSALYDPKSPAYGRVLQALGLMLQDQSGPSDLFFTPSKRFALEAMILNTRDEAGRYEPLEEGENSLSYAAAQLTNWPKYPYSVIVVPGAGNDRPGVRLSAAGKLRDEIAARRWREGKAPFILVSGGHVHPNRTEYAEALEMKHDLITRLAIPEQAIIVDPHARHTTTNMRNAARLMYRYGIPIDKKALVTTDQSQSAYIEGAVFEKRCKDELGYLPYKILGRISIFDLEFRPEIDSLQSDPNEPLDP